MLTTFAWLPIFISLMLLVKCSDFEEFLLISKISREFNEELVFLAISNDHGITDSLKHNLVTLMHSDYQDSHQTSFVLSDFQECLTTDQNQMMKISSFPAVVVCVAKSSFESVTALSPLKHTWILPSQHMSKLNVPLRLDSKVYAYHWERSFITITEMYAIHGNTIVAPILLNVHIENLKLFDFNTKMWERRSNLSQLQIRSATLPWVPLVEHHYNEKGDFESSTGIIPDILDRLQELLGFELIKFEPPDGFWGGLDPDGSWNGLVGLLQRNEADLTSTVLTVTKDRADVMDFSHEVIEDKIGLNTQVPDLGREVNYMAFIFIFSVDTWVMILVTMAALSFGYFLMNHFTKSSIKDKYRGHYRIGVSNSLSLVCKMYLQRNSTWQMRSNSSRVLYLVTGLSGFVLFSFYSAILTSLMAATAPPIEIESLWDVLRLDLDVLVFENTAQETVLKLADEGTVLNLIYEKKIKDNPHAKVSTDEQKYGLMKKNPGQVLEFGSEFGHDRQNGIIALNINDKFIESLALGFQKDSELLPIFNFYLAKLRENGVLSQILTTWLKKRPLDVTTNSIAYELGYYDLIFPFLAILCGMALCCSLVYLEYLMHKFYLR